MNLIHMIQNKLGKRVAILLIVLAALIPLAAGTSSYFEISKNLDIYATLFKELNTYYVDEIEPSKMVRKSIDAMLESLDPYTNYISESEIENYRMQTTGKYGGIGALIRNSGEYVMVAEPYEGYPADKSGLLAGDKILQIDGKDVKGKDTEEISTMLKGQADTKVDILIERLQGDGSTAEMTFELTREEVKIKNVPYYGMINDNIGYIRLSNFTEKAGYEVQQALEELKEKNDLKGLVIDLRGNPGGLLNEAVNVSNVFIPQGQLIVSTKGKIEEWDKSFKTLNPPTDTEIPLAVLTSRGSASASEIVSGSIQDLDRGVVVGQKTFGKGLVQTTRSLTYNTKLKVTTAKYYIPSGRCIQAINYADREDDGSVGEMPDSLKTAFTTNNGRVVYDGGGVDADVYVEPAKLSQITISLLSKNLIFDYATIYRANHEKIAEPGKFELNDKEYDEFIAFLADKEYDYTTKSEKLVEEMEEAVQKEKYYEAVQQELEKLKTGIMHDKNKDLVKFKREIKDLLEEEIVSRYYYRSGRIKSSFDNDLDVQEALNVLNDQARYDRLLTSGTVGKEEE